MQTHNSPELVTDDEIFPWKNVVFNEEMTSKMQPATGSGTVTEYTWERGSVVLLVKKKKKDGRHLTRFKSKNHSWN